MNVTITLFIPKITFTDENSTREEKMSFPMGQLIQAANLMNMNLQEGLQNVTLQAITESLLTSGKVLYNLTAVHKKPMNRIIVDKLRRECLVFS